MKTKILFVTGGDFSANSFEQKFGGTQVKTIIENIQNYQTDDSDEDEPLWDLSVLEFDGPIDPAFIKFIKSDIQDYDHSKNSNFYLETDIIK